MPKKRRRKTPAKRKKKSTPNYTFFKVLGKVLFVYPAKAISWTVKKTNNRIQKSKEKRAIQKIEENKPQLPAQYDIFSELKNKKGTFSHFEKKLFKNKSTIGLILGARGTGKSAIGMRLLENLKAKTNKKVYAMGFKYESLPHWIEVVDNVDKVRNNSVILLDEGGIEFSSRKSMSDANKFLTELMLIARHKDLSIIFITQNSANLEINAIRQADYLIMKPSSLLQKDFERKKIKQIYDSIDNDFEDLKETVGLTYIYSDNYQGFVTNSLPTFWSEKVSKSYS